MLHSTHKYSARGSRGRGVRGRGAASQRTMACLWGGSLHAPRLLGPGCIPHCSALRIALNSTAFGDYNGAMGERTPEWKINSGQGVGTPLSLSRGRVGGKGEKDTGFRRPLLPRLALHVVLAALPRMFSKPPTLSPGHILTRLSRPRSHDLSSEEHFHVPPDARLSVPSSASSQHAPIRLFRKGFSCCFGIHMAALSLCLSADDRAFRFSEVRQAVRHEPPGFLP